MTNITVSINVLTSIIIWFFWFFQHLGMQLRGVRLIDIESLQNRLLKVCYVPATSASLPRLSFLFYFIFLLLRPLTVLMKQTRWLKQSIFLDVYGQTWVAQQSVTKIISMTTINLVIPKAGAKCELLLNEPAICWTSKSDLISTTKCDLRPVHWTKAHA